MCQECWLFCLDSGSMTGFNYGTLILPSSSSWLVFSCLSLLTREHPTASVCFEGIVSPHSDFHMFSVFHSLCEGCVKHNESGNVFSEGTGPCSPPVLSEPLPFN